MTPRRQGLPYSKAEFQKAKAILQGSRATSTAEKCDRCGSHEFRDIPIHNGQSVRRDCGECGGFVRFTVWTPGR